MKCAQCGAAIPPPGIRPLFSPCCSLDCAQTWDARSCVDRGCPGCPDCQGLSGGQLDDLVEAMDGDGEMLERARQMFFQAIEWRMTQIVVLQIVRLIVRNVVHKHLELAGDPRADVWKDVWDEHTEAKYPILRRERDYAENDDLRAL